MEKTRKVMLGVTTTALAMGLAGCGSSTAELPPKPNDEACDDWDWDDDQGVWICDDSNSSHRGYYDGGRYYKNKNALLTSTDYANYKNSSSYKGGSKSSSGFGSGSKSYGG